MVARLLRRVLAAQILMLALALHFAGLPIVYAFPAAFGGLFVLYGLVILATFWVSGLFDDLGSLRLGRVRALRLYLEEWLAFFALFAIIQPFAHLFAVNSSLKDQARGGPAIILVHGYMCNAGLWLWLKSRLKQEGHRVVTVDLEPPFAGLDQLAVTLHSRIKTASAELNTETIILITHSMGGLVARACLDRYGRGSVGKLITLGCPHHGTRLARLGWGQNAREMEPRSSWLQSNRPLPPIELLNVWSTHDNFVSPQSSAELAGASNIETLAMGHLSMAFSPKILDILKRRLAEKTH